MKSVSQTGNRTCRSPNRDCGRPADSATQIQSCTVSLRYRIVIYAVKLMARKTISSKNHNRDTRRAEPDPRVQRTKQIVLEATFRLMSQAGIGGVSVDEVSRTTGVAKTTIYRHWPSRSALLMDACSKLRSPVEVPDTGNPRTDLMALGTRLATNLHSARWPGILPSIIDAAERDAEIAKLYARLQAGF